MLKGIQYEAGWRFFFHKVSLMNPILRFLCVKSNIKTLSSKISSYLKREREKFPVVIQKPCYSNEPGYQLD